MKRFGGFGNRGVSPPVGLWGAWGSQWCRWVCGCRVTDGCWLQSSVGDLKHNRLSLCVSSSFDPQNTSALFPPAFTPFLLRLRRCNIGFCCRLQSQRQENSPDSWLWVLAAVLWSFLLFIHTAAGSRTRRIRWIIFFSPKKCHCFSLKDNLWVF